MVDRLKSLTSKKKYGAAERAEDPQFEDSRDRFNTMVGGVSSVQSTLGKIRGDQLGALGQPVASLRNFYQDQPDTAETCSRTMRAIDDALVGYNAEHQKVCSTLSSYHDLLNGISRNIESRDGELIEFHKFKAQVAKGQVALDSPEREKQLKSSYEAANEQVKREVDAAYAAREEAFRNSLTQMCGMYAHLFASLHASIQPLVAVIPCSSSEPAPTKPLPPVSKPVAPAKPIPQPLIDLKAQQPAQQQQHRPQPQPPASSGTSNVPPKSSSVASQPIQPAQPTYKPRPFEAEPLKKPTVPDPVITDDMDEETRAIVMKRYEEDKMVAEQKWVMMRKRRELEEQIHNEKEKRILDDQKEELEYEVVVRQHQERMHAVDVQEAEETSNKEKKLADFRVSESQRQKNELKNQTQANADQDKADDQQRSQKRAQEDDDRKKRFEAWKKNEEERMRRELAARIRAQEEKERLEGEEISRRRAAEDREIVSDREARDKLLAETMQEELQKSIQNFEAALLKEAKESAEKFASERERLNKQHNEASKARLKEMELRTIERNKKDFAASEELAKVTRDIEDLERKEQREKVRRVEDDIERVERKERERREQDDLRRKAELEKIRRRQQELEELERNAEERRKEEDAKRAEMKQRMLDSNSSNAAPSSPSKPLPSPAPASSPAAAAAPVAKPLPTPSQPLPTPAQPLPSPSQPLPTPSQPLPAPSHPLPTPEPAVQPPAKALPEVNPPEEKKEPEPSQPAQQQKPASALDDFDPVHISEAQRQQYTALFQKANVSGTGIVTGTEGRNFFQRSHLPFAELGKIWKMADEDHDNKLSKPEFLIAMHLVYSTLKGHSLPATLPSTLSEDAHKA